MTEVISMEAKFKSTGVEQVVNGFEQIARAAQEAERKQRTLQDRGFYAAQRMQATAMKEMNKDFENRRKAALTMFPAFEKAKNSVGQWATANAGLLSGLGVAAGAIYGAGKAAAASYMEFQNYAGSVRDLSAISGTGAEETSRFIQVLDDFQISAQDVTTATKAMTKQGLAPTVETLAKLADQYKAIQDPMDRNAFVLKNLGKGGLNWVNALQQGGDALREMGDEVNANLILTDDQIAMSEQSRLAIDALSDSWQGIKVSIGAAVGEQIVSIQTGKEQQRTFAEYAKMAGLGAMNDRQRTQSMMQFNKVMEKGAAMTAYYSSLQQNTADTNGEVVQTEEEKNAALQMSLSGGLQLTQMQIAMRAKSLELNTALTEQTAVLEKLRSQGYTETGNKIQSQIAVVDQLKTAIAQSNTANEASYKSFASSVLAAKDATLEQQLAFAVASGQVTQGAANQQMAQDMVADAFLQGQISAQTYASQLSVLMAKVNNMDGKTANMYINVWIKEHGGGGAAASIIAQQAGNNANVQAGTVANIGGNQTMGGAIDDNWQGGQLGGNWTMVGDRPGGGFVKGLTELISPSGYVYDSKTSQQILESGMLNSVNSRAVGGEAGDYVKRTTKSTKRTATSGNIRPSALRFGSGDASMMNVSGAELIASNEQTAATTTQQTLQMQQQMQNYINQQIAQQQAGFDMLAAVLIGENPRAVGAAVSGEFAKLT
jgi:hypothetical protein